MTKCWYPHVTFNPNNPYCYYHKKIKRRLQKIYGQNEWKSKIEMMSRRALFDKKWLKAAPTDNLFCHIIFAGNLGTEKPWLLAAWLEIIIQFKQYVFSFSFAKKGKCLGVFLSSFFLSVTNYFWLIKKRIGYLLDRGNILGSRITLTFDSTFSLFSFLF